MPATLALQPYTSAQTPLKMVQHRRGLLARCCLLYRCRRHGQLLQERVGLAGFCLVG